MMAHSTIACTPLFSTQQTTTTIMSTDSNSLSSLSISSSSDEDFIDDPMDDKIEAKIEARIERQLAGSSNEEQRDHWRYLHRDHQGAHNWLHANYFSDNLVYTATQFRRRYRMRKHLLNILCKLLVNGPSIFVNDMMPLARLVFRLCKNAQ